MIYGNDWQWRANSLNYDLTFLRNDQSWLKINKYKLARRIFNKQLSKDRQSKEAFFSYQDCVNQIHKSLEGIGVPHSIRGIKNHPKKFSGNPYGTYILLCETVSKSIFDYMIELSDKHFLEDIKSLPIFADIVSFIESYSMSSNIAEKSNGISYICFHRDGICIKSMADNEGCLHCGEVSFDFKKHEYDLIAEEKLYSLVLACVLFFESKYNGLLEWDFDDGILTNHAGVCATLKQNQPRRTETPLKQW